MAGRVRLTITGIQDQWLTGEPQFSYFVMNYRRHTRFSIESVETPFDGQIYNTDTDPETDNNLLKNGGFGQTLISTIPQNVGDLVRSMMLKVTLNPLPVSTDPLVSNVYNTSIGSRIIEHADLMIGGQLIERLTGEYIYMYDQLHNNKDDTEQSLYFMNGHGNHIQFSQPYTFYVNLPFYFFRNPSLAIPSCAITRQRVEVRIVFKPADYKISYSYKDEERKWSIQPTNDGSIITASLITDFFFITDNEKNFLLTRPIEYVITQLQVATIVFKPNVTSRSVMLNFQHPVKELLFMATLQERNLTTQGGPSTLSGIVAESDSRLYLSENINVRSDTRFIKNISLEFNGSQVFDHGRTQLAYQQALQYHTGCPSPAYEFYSYSFALKPEVYYPTGQVNMSRIIHKKLTVELDETDPLNDIHVNVYALNYNVLTIHSGLAGLKF